MAWKRIADLLPTKQDYYLCCGATLDGLNPDCDYPDSYCIAVFTLQDKKFHEIVRIYEDIHLLFWTELPPLPKKGNDDFYT